MFGLFELFELSELFVLCLCCVCVCAVSVSVSVSACTIHVGTHHARSATAGKRSASTALAGTHNSVDADHRAGTGLFSQPRALVLPLVH